MNYNQNDIHRLFESVPDFKQKQDEKLLMQLYQIIEHGNIHPVYYAYVVHTAALYIQSGRQILVEQALYELSMFCEQDTVPVLEYYLESRIYEPFWEDIAEAIAMIEYLHPVKGNQPIFQLFQWWESHSRMKIPFFSNPVFRRYQHGDTWMKLLNVFK